jgi:hypothetical protein
LKDFHERFEQTVNGKLLVVQSKAVVRCGVKVCALSRTEIAAYSKESEDRWQEAVSDSYGLRGLVLQAALQSTGNTRARILNALDSLEQAHTAMGYISMAVWE